MKKMNEMRVEFPAKSVNEGLSRMVVAAFLAQLDPTVEELTDVKTAVSEAVTNCIVHGYTGGEGLIRIRAQVDESRKVRIVISDKGQGIGDIKQAMEPLFTTCTTGERSGMGFTIMQTFCDRVAVWSKPGKGTRVTITKQMHR